MAKQTKAALIDKAVRDLQNLKGLDTGVVAIKSEKILCQLLIRLGCGRVIYEYDKLEKNYDW